MADNFWDKVRERAYYKYLNRLQNNLPGNDFQDWTDAEIEQKVEQRIEEEAYLHFLSNGDYPLLNWIVARQEIMFRLEFLAFNLHEANIDRSPLENWSEAQKIYVENF